MARPPLIDHEAAALLHQVEEATRLLSTTEAVPPSVGELIDRLSDELDDGTRLDGIDPYLGQALLAATLSVDKAYRSADEELQGRRVRLGLERVRQALRDIVDAAPVDESRSAKQSAQWLARTVSVPQPELAALARVSSRTWQRWVSEESAARPEAEAEARVRALARVTAHLRHVFTGPGVVRWFERPHPDLNGQAPRTLLDDPLMLPRLIHLAARSRSTTAS